MKRDRPPRRRHWSFTRRRSVPFTEGNQIEVLVDGGPFFQAFLESVRAARYTVFVETYTLVADKTGWKIGHALAERAREGLEVAVCFDGFGSLSLSQEFVDFLEAAGVKVLCFRPLSVLRGRWPWSKRNHRKALIVDGHTAIVGGMNISDEYAPKEDGGGDWHDVAVRVVGPAARQLENMYRGLWSRYRGPPLAPRQRSVPVRPGRELARFVGNFARRDRAFIRRAYMRAILEAERTIRICNAYFVPDLVFTRNLIRAARRGVLIEIIVAGATDVPIILWATRWYYARLLRYGVRIYEFHERVLHAKTAVVDGEWVTIGSSNLDHMSAFRNLEVNAGIVSADVGQQMEAIFAADRAQSHPIDRRRWRRRSLLNRFLEWFFGRFRKVY